jgi:hypothetical protein
MASSRSPPVLSKRFGFACKSWISYQLEAQHLGGTYFVWFSGQLNPIANGDSSNPLELYQAMDRAVKKNDVNHPKLKDLKANLLSAISRLVAPRDPSLARLLKRDIIRAPVEMYRPQLWRLDLDKIALGRWKTLGATPSWDEQFVEDLRDGEFEVIVE